MLADPEKVVEGRVERQTRPHGICGSAECLLIHDKK